MTLCIDCPQLMSPGPKRAFCCTDSAAAGAEAVLGNAARKPEPPRPTRAERRRLAALARKGGAA